MLNDNTNALNKLLENTNVISHKLFAPFAKLASDNNEYIDEKINSIMTLIEPLKVKLIDKKIPTFTFNDTICHLEYINPEEIGFNCSSEILSKMNMMRKIILSDTKFVNSLNVYYADDLKDVIGANILKIIKRLHNLHQLFGDRKRSMNGFDTKLSDFDIDVYLYSNVRTANATRKGATYLERLYNTKYRCFNTASGATDFFGSIKHYDNKKRCFSIVVSRLEDILGLLTHEIFHAIRLVECNLIEFDETTKTINCEEGYVNAFASIMHALLFCFESDLMEDIYIKLALKCEIFHATTQAVKLNRITGISLIDIINDHQKFQLWTQHVALYEYIYMRLLILLNINILCEKTTIITKMLYAPDTIWDKNDVHCIDDFSRNIHTHAISNHICNFIDKFQENIDYKYEFNDEPNNNDATCGNMIMQYFMLDPMLLNNKHTYNLKGGMTTKKWNYKHNKVEYKRLSNFVVCAKN